MMNQKNMKNFESIYKNGKTKNFRNRKTKGSAT